MSFKVLIYNLKSDKNGNTILSYDLNSTGIFISNNLEAVTLKLDDKIFTIQKAIYMNKKIFDTGRTFLFIANKQIKDTYVFDLLMEYAISKLKTRKEHICLTLDKLGKELHQHRLLVA